MEQNKFSKWQYLLLVALFFAVAAQAQIPDHERPDDYPKKEILEDIKGSVIVKPESTLQLENDDESKAQGDAPSNSKEGSKTSKSKKQKIKNLKEKKQQ